MFYCSSLTSSCRPAWDMLYKCSPLLQTADNLKALTPAHCCNVLIAHASAQRLFSDDNLFTMGRQGSVKSCSLTLLPPPAKHSIDMTVPCTRHSKVNRLFNPLSWHAYEVWAMLSRLLLLMEHLFFICSEERGKGLRRKTQEGVKFVPGGQVWLMCHAALELCCEWNKDT